MCHVLITLLIGFPLVAGIFILHENIVGTPMELMSKKEPWWSFSLLLLLVISAIVLDLFIVVSVC